MHHSLFVNFRQIVLQTIDYLAPAFSCSKLSLYQPLKIHSDSVDKILQVNVSFFGLTDCTPDRDNKRVMGTGAKKRPWARFDSAYVNGTVRHIHLDSQRHQKAQFRACSPSSSSSPPQVVERWEHKRIVPLPTPPEDWFPASLKSQIVTLTNLWPE